MKKITTAVLLLSIILVVYSCGLRNHAECGYRALKFLESKHKIYREFIEKNQETFQAALPFPDWGYMCGYHDYAEEIHWPKMLNWMFDYFNKKFGNDPSKWNEETIKLVVLLFGIQSHSITDIVWHSIGGVNNGFIRENAKIAFKGHFQRSHDNADTGGDLVMSHQIDSDIITDKWYLPSEGIAKMYQKFFNNTVVRASVLEACSYTQYLIMLIEKNLAHLAYPLYGKDSMFLVDELFSYPIGGVDDMSHRTLYYWRDMINRIEKKNTTSNINFNQKIKHREDKNDKLNLLKKYKSKVIELLQPKIKKTKNGVLFYTEKTMKKQKYEQNFNDDSYFYKGYSFAKYRNTVVVSSPGFGIEGKPNTGKISFINENYEIVGKDLSSKFGYAMTFLDFNMDGKIDLVVSGPEFGASPSNYYPKGAVYIFLGDGSMKFKDTPDSTIYGDFGDAKQFSNIGRSLTVGDLNGDGFDDLIIGSPLESSGRGSVTVYFARKEISKVYQNVKDSNLNIFGSVFSYFGTKIVFEKNENPMLFIGAPKMSAEGIDSRGCLYAYEFKENKFILKFSIQGSNKFDQTGMNFAIGKPFNKDQKVIAISSSTKETMNPRSNPQGGIVSIIDYKNLIGNLELKKLNSITTFVSNRGYSRLGWEIGFSDLNNDGTDEMWISEPMRRTSLGRDTGAVYKLDSGSKFPRGNILNIENVASKIWRGGKIQSRFGHSMIQAEKDGKKGFYISSPFRNENGRNSGFFEFKE
eukprot:gene5895-9723_t